MNFSERLRSHRLYYYAMNDFFPLEIIKSIDGALTEMQCVRLITTGCDARDDTQTLGAMMAATIYIV